MILAVICVNTELFCIKEEKEESEEPTRRDTSFHGLSIMMRTFTCTFHTMDSEGRNVEHISTENAHESGHHFPYETGKRKIMDDIWRPAKENKMPVSPPYYQQLPFLTSMSRSDLNYELGNT